MAPLEKSGACKKEAEKNRQDKLDIPTIIRLQRGGDAMKQQITYTNFVMVNGEAVRFLDLPPEARTEIANQARRIPLETLGKVEVVRKEESKKASA